MDLSKHLVIFKPNVYYDDCLCHVPYQVSKEIGLLPKHVTI